MIYSINWDLNERKIAYQMCDGNVKMLIFVLLVKTLFSIVCIEFFLNKN